MRGCDGRRVTRGIRFGLQSAGAPWRWPGIFGRLRACQSHRSPSVWVARRRPSRHTSLTRPARRRGRSRPVISTFCCGCGAAGGTVGNSPGSKWTAFNAIAEHLDYGRRYTSRTNQVQRSFEDTSVKQRALRARLGGLNSKPSGTSVKTAGHPTRVRVPSSTSAWSYQQRRVSHHCYLVGGKARRPLFFCALAVDPARAIATAGGLGLAKRTQEAGSGHRPVMRSAR